MKKERLTLASLLAVAALAVLASGCAVTAASTGLGVAYAKGNLESLVPAPSDEVLTATEAALDQLGIFRVATDFEGASAKVLGRTPEGKKVQVRIIPKGKNASKVAVRVGTFGNQRLRNEIFAGVYDQLAPSDGLAAEPASR